MQRRFLAVQKEFARSTSTCGASWAASPGSTAAQHGPHSRAHAESDAMSADLKKRGFRFVGSTICYAHMQAVRHGERPREILLPLQGMTSAEQND